MENVITRYIMCCNIQIFDHTLPAASVCFDLETIPPELLLVRTDLLDLVVVECGVVIGILDIVSSSMPENV